MRSIGISLAFSIAFFLASCDRPAEKPSLPPATPPAGGTDASKPAPGKSSTDTTLGELRKATSPAAEAGKEIAATAKDAMADADAAIGSSVTAEKVKEMTATAAPEKLKVFADKILAAIQEKEAASKGLGDRLAALSADEIAKAPGLKNEIDSLAADIAQLKAKLRVVVDQLRAKGLDVSRYTAFLG